MQDPLKINISEFKYFQKFHFFYYSRQNNQTYFLLRQQKSGQYAEIRGCLEQHDPAILFSAGRKIMEISSGLLTQQNLQFFAQNSPHTNVSRDMLQFCKPKQQMPVLQNSKLYQKFIEDTFETMQPYQENNNDDAYYFVEIPYVNLDKLHAFCQDNSINPELRLRYATPQEILCSDPSFQIDASMKHLFTPDLTCFVQRYIEKAEPIPIKARYAVVCILTTPTNYRTMGLIGSYYKKHGEQWKFYRFPLEEPTIEELGQLDGLLIPGATVCAADKSLVWREKLLKLIRTVYNDYPLCKILGTCFGIQIVAEALDGKCERMSEPIRGSSKLNINKDFWELPYVKQLGVKPKQSLFVSKSHFDAVTKVPDMMTVYASSEHCSVEIIGVEDRLLAFQGHPEINESWTACLIYQATSEKMKFDVFFDNIKQKYFQEKFEHELWLRIVYSFFKQKVLKN